MTLHAFVCATHFASRSLEPGGRAAVATSVRISFTLVLLLTAPVAADEDDLVLQLVRQVACLGPTLVPGDYDLGPLLAIRGRQTRAQRLLESFNVSDEEFAALRRERALWVLCALLDHRRSDVQARAAEALAAIADPRAAPLVWLHGRRHYVAYPEGTPRARVRTALVVAARAIGMEPSPRGFDFLVQHWLTPASVPQEMELAMALQRRLDAGEKVTWEEVLRKLPPTKQPIGGIRGWRWYPIHDSWMVVGRFIKKLRDVRVEPRLPEATRWGPVPNVRLSPRPTAEDAVRIANLVRELDNPKYKNRTAPDFPFISSGPRMPTRSAVWALLPHGGKIAYALIPQLAQLDEEGAYAGLYALRRVVSPGASLATEVFGDRDFRGGVYGPKAWCAWLDLVRAGVPRGGLGVHLRGSRTLRNGEIELDYTIGWFGNWRTPMAFAEGRPNVTVRATDPDGRIRTLRARERYAVHASNLELGPHALLLGRFVIPAGEPIVRACVRLTLPPPPAALRGVWSGTVESNTIEIAD
jgi:hypothetical protein